MNFSNEVITIEESQPTQELFKQIDEDIFEYDPEFMTPSDVQQKMAMDRSPSVFHKEAAHFRVSLVPHSTSLKSLIFS